MSARIAKYRFWKRNSCYLYDHPFGSIYLSPMMAIMQQRVKSRKRHSLTWRQCPKGVDPSLTMIRCMVHCYQWPSVLGSPHYIHPVWVTHHIQTSPSWICRIKSKVLIHLYLTKIRCMVHRYQWPSVLGSPHYKHPVWVTHHIQTSPSWICRIKSNVLIHLYLTKIRCMVHHYQWPSVLGSPHYKRPVWVTHHIQSSPSWICRIKSKCGDHYIKSHQPIIGETGGHTSNMKFPLRV